MSPHEAADQGPDLAPFLKDDLLQFSLRISGIGTWQLSPVTQTVTWDNRCKELYGFAPGDEVPYDQVLRYLHPDDKALVDHAVTEAIQGKNNGSYELRFRTIGAADEKLRWLLCKGQAFFDAAGQPVLFAGTAQDISDLVRIQQEAIHIEKVAREAINSARFGTYNYNFQTGAFLYSPQAKRIFSGTSEGELTRQDFIDRVHPGDHPAREAAHEQALETGILKYECRAIWDDGTTHWVRINGAYEFDENKQPVFYTGIMEDITEPKIAQTALQKSEQFARSVVQDSPVAKFITVGDSLLLETVNKEMQVLLGVDNDFAGQPLLQALPAFQNTSVPQILADVRHTGARVEVAEECLTGLNPADSSLRYYYHKHSPLRDAAGEVYGVISSWIDVTAEVTLRNQAAAAQTLLEAAIETAQLGTFEINPQLGIMEVSPRIREWMGFEPGDLFTREQALATLEDAAPLQAAIRGALRPEGDGIMDVEYQMVHRKTKAIRFIRSRGQRFHDENRGPIIVGTSQDITAQRSYEIDLEQQVQVRTEELAAVVEELQASNEDLAATNTQLLYSNEELAQYAYVASHDLQEPLRKIQVFSGMLDGKAGLTDSSGALLAKISQSANRMALLIRDLLEFSRLLKADNRYQTVDLNNTVTAVLNDFELIGKEKNAVFSVAPLPTIAAVGLQMNQLFYNLIGNALKFTRPGMAPRIMIDAVPITTKEAAEHILQPIADAQYYRICVQDNGIGFEAEYAEQIFEVFKRLHGRDAYPGSGIGLALCRRILANHDGVLYTQATPGSGATFCFILPDRREDRA